VDFSIRDGWSSVGSATGSITLQGLPYTPKIQSGLSYEACSVSYIRGITVTAQHQLTPQINENSNVIFLYISDLSGGGGVPPQLQHGACAATGFITVSGTYWTDDAF